MSQLVASFIDGKLACYDPSVVDGRPPQRAVALIEHHGDNGPVEVNRAPDERRTITKAATTEAAATKTAPTIAAADPIEQIAQHLAKVARLAQAIEDENDRRRARELVSATASLLAASTRLPDRDQRILETALRAQG